MNKDNP